MHWETKKIVSLALLWYSLYCGGLEPNIRLLWGIPAFSCLCGSQNIGHEVVNRKTKFNQTKLKQTLSQYHQGGQLIGNTKKYHVVFDLAYWKFPICLNIPPPHRRFLIEGNNNTSSLEQGWSSGWIHGESKENVNPENIVNQLYFNKKQRKFDYSAQKKSYLCYKAGLYLKVMKEKSFQDKK